VEKEQNVVNELLMQVLGVSKLTSCDNQMGDCLANLRLYFLSEYLTMLLTSSNCDIMQEKTVNKF